MLNRIPLTEDGTPDEKAKQKLDEDLSVVRWQVPGDGNRFAEVEIEEGAPSWWAGDEEASQSNLAVMRAMGANV